MDNLIQVADIIMQSSNIVAFTGAGVSTESNIPDFRSNSGLFSSAKYKYPPEVMLSHSFFMENTELFYEYYKSNMVYRDAKPNSCHLGLARLEEMGVLKAVITQNVDGLHQGAGAKNVLELHGSVSRNYCMECRKEFSLNYVMDSPEVVPKCDKCDGIVRPDVVLYEEMLDNDVMSRAVSCIRKADVLLVMGTSLVVYPAAGLIEYYKGNKLILVNMSVTPYDSRANVVLREKAGYVMKYMAGV